MVDSIFKYVFLKNIKMHDCCNHDLILSKKYDIFIYNLPNKEFTLLGRLPVKKIDKAFYKVKILQRLLRKGIHNVIYLPYYKNYLAIANKKLFLKKGQDNFFNVGKIERGTRILPTGLCKDKNDNLYYGDYWKNKNREPVYLYKSSDGGETWKSQYVFKGDNQVRHIHSVQYDKYEDKLWLTTGDCDTESGIYFSTDGGKSFSSIGRGDQSWRAVTLLFTEEYIYWGTDSPEEQNYIFRYHRKKDKRERLQKVNGPIYYGTKTKESVIFTTAVEKNDNECEKKVHFWFSRDGLNWVDYISFNKDLWPAIFQYGTVDFGRCNFHDDFIFFNPVALKGLDSHLCRMCIIDD
jgi:hypothetical protein